MKLVAGWWMPDSETHFTEFFKGAVAPTENPVPYQEKQRNFTLSHVKSWRTCIDVGGNVGTWSRPLSERFQNIVAFEPNPTNRECYLENLKSRNNWKLEPYALSDQTATLPLWIHDVSCGNVSLDKEGVYNGPTTGKPTDGDIYSIDVEVRTLDSFDIKEVDLIKIDVQGHEFGVLKGATRLLTEQSPVIVAELPQRYPEEIAERNAITTWLAGYGYTMRGFQNKETVYTK